MAKKQDPRKSNCSVPPIRRLSALMDTESEDLEPKEVRNNSVLEIAKVRNVPISPMGLALSSFI